MLLREAITRLAEALKPAARRRVEAALRTLCAELGEITTTAITDEYRLAQRVHVDGDEAEYVVFGTWGDGTLDLIREQGSFASDVLVGWRPGQSLQDYQAELTAEVILEDFDG